MMTYANAFVALRRVRDGLHVQSHVLVQLRRRGLLFGPLCLKMRTTPKGLVAWEHVWTLTADAREFLALVEGALAWRGERVKQVPALAWYHGGITGRT